MPLDTNASKELTIRDFAVIYRRRRKLVYRAIAICALLGALYCIFSTRRYEATSTLEVRSKSQDKLGLENMVEGSSENDADSLAANINIETQANILQSDTLALKTIDSSPHGRHAGLQTSLESNRLGHGPVFRQGYPRPPKCQPRRLSAAETSGALGVQSESDRQAGQRNPVDPGFLSEPRSQAWRLRKS